MLECTPHFAHQLREMKLASLPDEHRVTLDLIRNCPQEFLAWRPHEKSMTFAALAVHIYETGPWFLDFIKSGVPGDYSIVPASNIDALVQQCQLLHDRFVKGFRAFSAEQLSQTYEFFEVGMVPGILLLEWHIKHWIHHRGQLQLYLRLMGANCPAVYGPSADVTLEDLQAAGEGA